MADKYINAVGLQKIKEWASDKFTNTIEKIKVNGTEVTPDTNKAVNVVVPEVSVDTDVSIAEITDTNGNTVKFSQALENVAVKFGQNTPTVLASTDYVDEYGGKIDKIKVNGTAQTITNKEVDISMPTIETERSSGQVTEVQLKAINKEGLRLENSDLDYMWFWFNEASGAVSRSGQLVTKNYVDGEFRTAAQVQQAIDDALADVTGIDFQVVDTLPATGAKGVIYLVPVSQASPNSYDEYIWVTPTGGTARYEKIGSTEVDLSNYWTSASGHANSLEAMTVSEIEAILNA